MARPKDPNPTPRTLFNVKMSNSAINRIKTICFRRSVHANHKLSESKLIEELAENTPLPKPPTIEQLTEYGRPPPDLLPE